MNLLEEEGEGEDEDIDGVYDPETFDPEEGNAEEYDPHKPDLELQYLVNKANLMEQKKELMKEEERAEEEDLFQIMHAYCNYCEGCSDWSTCLPGANKWKPGSPDHDDDDWQPQSPDKAYLKALCRWASSTTPPPGLGEERPEEMHYITHSNLPVYQTEIGPLKILSLTAVSACIPMKTILDTGAESNYIAAKKAQEAGMQIFPITVREIVGAGQTTTSAFAMFTLNIGRILTQCYAYVLDNTMQFQYDLLLGCAWLKKYNMLPNWRNNTYKFEHPETKVHFCIEPIGTKSRGIVPRVLTKIASQFQPKHDPCQVELLHHAQEEVPCSDESTCTTIGSKAVKEMFNERIK
jgi:hypothetical protein